jgi:hypothetical protein
MYLCTVRRGLEAVTNSCCGHRYRHPSDTSFDKLCLTQICTFLFNPLEFLNWFYLNYPQSGSGLESANSNCRVEELHSHVVIKGKVIPLQALTGPGGSRSVRLPYFKTVGI